jgi:hypothetical protein
VRLAEIHASVRDVVGYKGKGARMSESRRQRLDALRLRVESLARDGRISPEDAALVEELVTELAVYKGELEVQNETLRETLAELEASRVRFQRLFQYAPIGYAVL